ncbi:MAG: GNAT family N-acetyltransferase [Firmicutes bacterium]|nr:GNAT family N-acetyltransferase [Bacillota bacterium]MBQ3198841.1 GNAT family N-acetyltransferase [Bacillota bacterium]
MTNFTLYPAKKADLHRIKRLYKQAFPPNERKPWANMQQLCKDNKGEILALQQNGQFAGLAITLHHRDLVLLDYLAVEPGQRSHGIGSLALSALQNRYQNRRLVVEIERPDAPGMNKPLCERRREFYRRAGLLDTGLIAHVYQTEFLLLTPNQPLTFAEYYDLYYQLFGAETCSFLGIRDISPKARL